MTSANERLVTGVLRVLQDADRAPPEASLRTLAAAWLLLAANDPELRPAVEPHLGEIEETLARLPG